MDRLAWNRDGRDWPNREASRFVAAAGFTWHVQRLGEGPVALLLHGTGATTHSWRGLVPLLARELTVIAPDLPGHGFTDPPPREALSLPGMAAAVAALLSELGAEPALAAGHSAGAAVAVRMSLDGRLAAKSLISLNGALLPLGGAAGRLFSPLARLIAQGGLWPRLFARRARERAVIERLIAHTGSTLDPKGVELYARLAQSPAHVAAALGMMARWDLRALERSLSRLEPALLLVVGDQDRSIPPAQATRVAARAPRARVVRLPGLGHLAHEECPGAVAQIMLEEARTRGVLPGA